jgi:hypothetical protein
MTEVIEQFPDEQRQILKRLVMNEQLHHPSPVLIEILSRLNGTDTVLFAHRAYASRGTSIDDDAA